MGLLSSIKGSIVGKALDTLSAAFIKPGDTLQAVFSKDKTIDDVIKKVDSQSLTKNITSTVVNTAVAAGVVVGFGAVASAAKAGTLIPTATKVLSATANKPKLLIGAAVAAPVVIGAVSQNPLKAASTAANLPSDLANVGANLANLGANPSIDNLKTLVKENPVIVGTAAAGAALATGALSAGVVSSYLNTKAVKENTLSTMNASSSTGNQGVLIKDSSGKADFSNATPVVANNSPIPQLPQTTAASKVSSGTKKRVPRKKQYRNINQIVSVNVSNVGIKNTKRYINQNILN